MKWRSERRVGGKTGVVEQAREIGSHPGRARRASQDASRRNAPFDGSRARSQNGEVFTDRVASALGAASMAWAAAERSASRRIEEARQARQWFGRKQTSHHSHFGGVKPLGARTLAPPKKRSGWRTRNPKLSAGVRQRPRRERTRHGCSRLKQQMAETDRTHRACGSCSVARRCVKPVR